MVTTMLKFFYFDAYFLLDLIAILSFVTPYVAMCSVTCYSIFYCIYSYCDSIVAKRVYRKFFVFFSHRVSLIDLVYHDMQYFHAILCIDWMHS